MKTLRLLSILLFSLTALTACHDVDDDIIPYAEVSLTFRTVGEWNLYGVQADAAGYRRYILSNSYKEPVDYPYTSLDRTGYGGLLLVSDVLGDLYCYDLACPVESPEISRLRIPDGELYAECPKCGSTYDVFTNHGMPLSGYASREGYGLKRYRVLYGGTMEYIVVTR